jgi:hypothetical protein
LQPSLIRVHAELIPVPGPVPSLLPAATVKQLTLLSHALR